MNIFEVPLACAVQIFGLHLKVLAGNAFFAQKSFFLQFLGTFFDKIAILGVF
jgi:hypothetical protein